MVSSEGSNIITVACSADDNYAMPLAVTLHSLVSCLKVGTEIKIYVLSLGITSESSERIRRATSRTESQVRLEFISVDASLLEYLPPRGHVSVAAYLRIFLPSLLPATCSKVLYLDSDLLVKRDVNELWQSELGNNLVMAVLDPWIPFVSTKGAIYNWRELGMNPDAPYFNSGVLLLNLKEWRYRNLSETLLKFISEHKDHMDHADQDALNAVCYGSWGMLDMTWNVIALPYSDVLNWTPSLVRDYVIDHYDELRNRPSICHFAARWKPWSPGYMPPFQRDWFRAIKICGWFTGKEYRTWYVSWLLQHYSNAVARRLFGVSDSLGQAPAAKAIFAVTNPAQ